MKIGPVDTYQIADPELTRQVHQTSRRLLKFTLVPSRGTPGCNIFSPGGHIFSWTGLCGVFEVS